MLIFQQLMNFHHNDEFSSQWWIFITPMNFHNYDKFSSQWWIFITMMTFHHNDECSLQCWFSIIWWILITMMNFHPKYLYNYYLKYSSIELFHPNDEYSIAMINFHNNDEFYLWIFIIMMNLNRNDKHSSQLEFLSQL